MIFQQLHLYNLSLETILCHTKPIRHHKELIHTFVLVYCLIKDLLLDHTCAVDPTKHRKEVKLERREWEEDLYYQQTTFSIPLLPGLFVFSNLLL